VTGRASCVPRAPTTDSMSGAAKMTPCIRRERERQTCPVCFRFETVEIREIRIRPRLRHCKCCPAVTLCDSPGTVRCG
jgi:hypothetical protein